MGSIVRRSPVFGALFFGSALVAFCATRPITETDLLKFRWVADPQISPDGRQVAYVLVEVNEKEDRYDTSLWAVAARAGSEPRRLTAGPRDSAPRWSPDSSTLAFLRAAGEKERPQIHLLPMNGGDARRLTDLPRGVSAAVWSPLGKTIAFTSGTTSEDLEEQRRDKEKGDSKEKPKKSDVRIVSQRSVADWSGLWFTSDFTLFAPMWFRSDPVKDPQEFLARSPVRYADRIVTPMLFVEGDDDLRTPPAQGGEAMFRALKVQKKTAVMVRFPGETHELSRSGRPSHRVERLQHIVNWFEKYLMGRKINTYGLYPEAKDSTKLRLKPTRKAGACRHFVADNPPGVAVVALGGTRRPGRTRGFRAAAPVTRAQKQSLFSRLWSVPSDRAAAGQRRRLRAPPLHIAGLEPRRRARLRGGLSARSTRWAFDPTDQRT